MAPKSTPTPVPCRRPIIPAKRMVVACPMILGLRILKILLAMAAIITRSSFHL